MDQTVLSASVAQKVWAGETPRAVIGSGLGLFSRQGICKAENKCVAFNPERLPLGMTGDDVGQSFELIHSDSLLKSEVVPGLASWPSRGVGAFFQTLTSALIPIFVATLNQAREKPEW